VQSIIAAYERQAAGGSGARSGDEAPAAEATDSRGE
jgi:hypothetical protein